jgi:molecular chaperone GrpE
MPSEKRTAPVAGDGSAETAVEDTAVSPPAPEEAVAQAPLEREQVEADLEELVAKAHERDEYLALAQRTQADFDNYRRRMTRDLAGAEGRGIAKAARELLPALDNLERAVVAADEHPDDALAEGIRLLHAETTAALARLGIETFRPDGEPFDPEQHEAMATQPAEGAKPGTVVEVYQQGYRLNGSVIRPARVVVAG